MDRELEEKVVAFRILESRLEALLKQREMISNKLLEIQSTLNSIDEMEKSNDILFSIGSEAYATGKIADKNTLIVEVGANVALEKTVKEGKEILNTRKAELEGAMKEVQKGISEASTMINQLGPEIQAMSENLEESG